VCLSSRNRAAQTRVLKHIFVNSTRRLRRGRLFAEYVDIAFAVCE